jgi:pyrroline-5-carboxylate reductase
VGGARADVLLLSVRPDSLREAVADVVVRPGTVVISAIAGAGHGLLRELLGDDCTIVRAVPMPAVQTRNSVTVVYPANDTARALFEQLGGSIVADDEREFAALMASTATISTFMQYVGTIVEWLAGQGIEAGQADRYVRGFFHAASVELADDSRSLRDLTQDHETAGGLNEQLRRTWFEPAADGLRRGLDALGDRAR